MGSLVKVCVAVFYKAPIMNAAYADIDECSEGLDVCASNAICSNTEGGYNCSCDTGYHGDGITCEGNLITINEYYKVESANICIATSEVVCMFVHTCNL